MRALLLAGGLGLRLRPLTNTIPKCLARIKDKILLEIWIDKLINIGIEKILVNTHYLPEKVEEVIALNKHNQKIEIINEPILLGTGKTIIQNSHFFNSEDALVIHADNYSKADLFEFIETHKKRPKFCLMTMMTFKTNEPSNCGIVELDNENVVQDFFEKKPFPPGNIANAAIYILTNEMLKILSEKYKDKTDFSTEIISEFIGKIFTYHTEKTHIDIGTYANYLKANGI